MQTHTLDSTWLNVGTRRQFFFDDLMLDQAQDVTRRHHHPQRVSDEPLIKADRPWEHVTYFTCNTWNVIRDPADGLFKCWYEDWMIDDPSKAKFYVRQTDGKICVDAHAQWPSRLCYAQSEDGLHWEKPPLGIVRENGHDTNIVLGGESIGMVHCAYVLLDGADPDPNRRFKAMFEQRRMAGDDNAGAARFAMATSPDGLRWSISDRTVRFGPFEVMGDVVTISRDPESKVYWTNNRHPDMCSITVHDRRKPCQHSWLSPVYRHEIAGENRRRVYRSQSVDLFDWSTPQPLVVPESDADNIDDAFYGMEQFQAGDDWIGLLNVLHMADNTMEVQLAHARDGIRFQRVRPGEAWLGPRPGDAWDRTMVTICSKPVEVGDDLFVYHAGASNHHDWWFVGTAEGLAVPETGNLDHVNYAMGLAKIKKDRFVSIGSGDAREGLIVTPALRTKGGRLLINAVTRPGGAVRVAVADGQDIVHEGFEHTNCVALEGDAVSHEVKWNGQNELPPGEMRKLHIYLRKADIFSFEFCE